MSQTSKRIGPPLCDFSEIDEHYYGRCREPQVVESGLNLCVKHLRYIARCAGYVPQHKVDRMARRQAESDVARLNSKVAFLEGALRAEREKPKRERPEHGHIYFLLSDNAVKIGWTSDLEQRMKSYSPGTKILAVMPGARKDETRLHRKFSHLRTNRREWFAYSPQVMEEVERIVKEHGDPPRDLNEPVTTTRIVGPRLTNYTQRRARSLGK